jgi:flagellar hook-associated protein 3 FlgL
VSGQHSDLYGGVSVTQTNSDSSPLSVSKIGDQSTTESFFSIIGDFVSGLEKGDRGMINRAISEITVLQEDMAIVLGDVGSAINNLDRQSDINSDTRLRIDQLLSGEKDLDYAQAVTKFNQEMVRLEATQASFAKVAQLSLFEYI